MDCMHINNSDVCIHCTCAHTLTSLQIIPYGRNSGMLLKKIIIIPVLQDSHVALEKSSNFIKKQNVLKAMSAEDWMSATHEMVIKYTVFILIVVHWVWARHEVGA